MTLANTPTSDSERKPQWATKVDDISLDNMYLIDKGIYRSEQPLKQEFPILEEFGIKEVLNLRNYHNDNDEAEDTSILLHHIRMKAHNIEEEDIVQAMQIIMNRQGSILIHCWHGSDRTGTIVAMYRIIFQNWTKEDALEELQHGEYGYHKIFGNIITFINNIDIENIKKQIGLGN